jgi:ABC-type transport system involved in cytochrome c biogenesis permease subunit
MSAEQIRAVGCGPIGAILSAIIASLVFRWQAKHWSHWIPVKVREKGKKQLLEEYKSTIWIAKALSIGGFLIGGLFYANDWMDKYDWRGLGVGCGLASFLPVSYIVAANIIHGAEGVKEAMVAFVIDQKTPPKVLFAFMGLCFIGGVVSAVSLLHKP